MSNSRARMMHSTLLEDGRKHGVEYKVPKNPSLRRLDAALHAWLGFVESVDEYRATVPVDKINLQASMALADLRDFAQIRERLAEVTEYGVPLADLPEFLLVLRLRQMNYSWAEIAEYMNIQTPGLYKRYHAAVDRAQDGQRSKVS